MTVSLGLWFCYLTCMKHCFLLWTATNQIFCSLKESKSFFNRCQSSPDFLALLYQSLCVISCCNSGPAESSTLTHVSSLHCLHSSNPAHSPLTFYTLTFGFILSSTQCDFALSHAPGSSIISTLHNPDVEMETGAAAKAWCGWKLGV